LDFGEISVLTPEKNFLEFNGTLYKEDIGLAQGSKGSPEIADINLHSLERIFVDQISKLIMYRRYRDDIFISSEADKNDSRIHN
jgi:retron-type reverse transcriptase